MRMPALRQKVRRKLKRKAFSRKTPFLTAEKKPVGVGIPAPDSDSNREVKSSCAYQSIPA